MNPMNNPMMQLLGMAMRGGGDPMQMLRHVAGQNPQAAQLMQMLQGKSPQQIQQMAVNMARERGTSVEQIARSLGLPMK